MHLKNRFILLLLPSVLSAATSIILSALTQSIAFYTYYLGKGAFYDYLFGPNSSAELILQSQGTVSAFTNTVFGNRSLSKVLFFAFWMIVGLVVYVVLHILIKGASVAAEDIEEATYKNSRMHDMLTSLGRRIAIRLAFFMAWVIYSIFFVKSILPLTILLARTAGTPMARLSSWGYGLLAFVVLTLSLHIHVILIRLIALRVRLFDNDNAIESQSHNV